MTDDRLTATAAPALAADNSEWILFITDLSDTTTDGTELGVWWATPGATDADKDLIVYTPVNGDPSSFAASWVPQGIMQLDGDTLTGVLVDVVYSDSVATVADLTGTEVDTGGSAFTASFDDGLIGLPVSSLTDEFAALADRTVALVPFTDGNVDATALAVALGVGTGGGGAVDAVLYDLTGETPGVVPLDLTDHPADKATAVVLLPAGDDQTMPITPPDPATHGHIGLVVELDGSVTASLTTTPEVAIASTVVTVDSVDIGTVLALLVPTLSSYMLIESGLNVAGGGAPSGAAGGDLAGTYPNPTVPGLADKLGTDATTADIADSTDKRYVTDAQLVVIGNTSGTNTGDETEDSQGSLIHASSSKTTPVDADELPLVDSAAGNTMHKVTWANLKATLKTYFDSLYPSGSGTSSGTNTGDQTITLTGDVTGTGTGSFVTAIGSGVIVNADINASAAIALSKLATDPLARANHTGTQLAATVSDFDTQVRTSRLDQMAAPTADLSINSHKLTNVTDPSSAQHAATKNYVDTTAAPATLVSSDQSGTTYTTVLADANTLVRLTNASLVTVTIPTNASVAYPLNTILTFHARGAAGGTLAAAGGVTIRNNSTATFAQYAEISVRKDGTDEWIRVG